MSAGRVVLVERVRSASVMRNTVMRNTVMRKTVAAVAVAAAAALAGGCATAPGARPAAVPTVSAVASPAARATGAARLTDSAASCNPEASSLAPAGPPAVTPGSFMATIEARGYLIAGVDQSTYRFGYLNPLDGKIEGFDIDMINAIAEAIFGSPGHVEYKAITDAERIPDLLNGSVDIVAHTMTITCARLQQVDFSSVYFDAHSRFLVLKNSTATRLSDLAGQKVCATTGSDTPSVIAGLPAAARPVLVTVPYWTDCLVLLQQYQVAGIVTDDAILYGLAAQDPFTKVVGPPLTNEPYGLAISRQHPDFVRFVNAVLARERSDGAWAASYAHWIGTPVPAPPVARYAS
jgi:polar amino acid transport system substrate-binding protein